MDSRVEELAAVIQEYCESKWKVAKDNPSASQGQQGDRLSTYRRIDRLALEMLAEIRDYRDRHPEEYD